MAKIIIVYSTTDGHTKEICQRLKEVIEAQENQVALVSVEDTNSTELKSFDKIVLGASIRYGKHNPKVYQFIENNREILEQKSNAFFSVNVVARKPEKNTPETNPYLIKFLNQISWKPQNLAVFAGKIDYQKYQFFDRFMIHFIMWMTKGPTDPKTCVDYTDWKQVEEFDLTIDRM